jgi:hypothetical protein
VRPPDAGTRYITASPIPLARAAFWCENAPKIGLGGAVAGVIGHAIGHDDGRAFNVTWGRTARRVSGRARAVRLFGRAMRAAVCFGSLRLLNSSRAYLLGVVAVAAEV